MAVTWHIKNMEATKTVGSLSDVVHTVHWTATDKEFVETIGHFGHRYGSIELAAPDSSSFTAYDSLTEDTIIGWVKTSIGTEGVTEIENQVAAQITESKTPTEISGVPW